MNAATASTSSSRAKKRKRISRKKGRWVISHVVAIKTEIFDLAALKLACAELGLTFVENQKTMRWVGRWFNDYAAADAAYKLGIPVEKYGTCSHAIKVPGSTFEIGVIRNQQTNGYKLYWDYIGPGQKISQAVGGQDGRKLVQLYAKHKALLEAKKKGWIASAKTVGSEIHVTISNL